MPLSMGYVYLGLAIALEVLATSSLKATGGFTRVGPTALVLFGYTGAFYCLAQVLATIPLGVAYAVWSGAGILLITLAGIVWYGERVPAAAMAGIAFIVVGIVILRLSAFGTH